MALLAVLLAFLILPAGRLTFEPLSKAASDLKQTISDYLFFNKPRNVFTLGSYGFYPMLLAMMRIMLATVPPQQR